MRIVLLGATGYLGKNIAYKMSKMDYKIYCVSRHEIDNNEDVSHIIYISTKEIEKVLSTSRLIG